MSQSYPARVANNILPLSVSDSLPAAFKEWYFTEYTEDHEKPVETCQLCDQEDLRYHFEIKNRNTENTLLVGSHCILKFQVSVFEHGELLDSEGAKKKLDRLQKKMRQESCMRALESLADKEENDILKNALNYYKSNGFLTPKFAYVVFWRLESNGIDHSKSFFKVSLKKDWLKKSLKDMLHERVLKIWPALSSSQKKLAERLGHSPPESK